MQYRAAYRPVCLTARRAQTASTGHQRTLAFSRFIGAAFTRGFLLLVAYRLRFAGFTLRSRFGRRFCPRDTVAQA